MTIRTVLAEDEPNARAVMRALLETMDEVEVVAETAGAETVEVVRRMRPDLLLLDVRMPGMNGFEVLDSLAPTEVPYVVFVTAYDEYAVEAFNVRAVDYVLKPFTDQRFSEAVRRAVEGIELGDWIAPRLGRQPGGRLADVADSAASAILRDDRVVIREGARTLLLPPAEITWVEASGTYVVIHRAESDLLVRVSLTEMNELLSESGFFRVHRSAVVNLRSVREVRPLSHGDCAVILEDGTRVRLTRGRRQEFERLLLTDEPD